MRKIKVSGFDYNDGTNEVADWYWQWVCPVCRGAGDIGKGPYGWLFDQVGDHVDTYHTRQEADR